MSDQRTEAPTPRRLEEARRKGEPVGRSQELTMAATLGTGVLVLAGFLPGSVAALGGAIRISLERLAARPDPTAGLAALGDGLGLGLAVVAPLGGAVLGVGVLANLASGGIIVSTGAVRFEWNRLNPLVGLRRLANREALTRLGIALAKLGVLAAAVWLAVAGRLERLLATSGASAGLIAAEAAGALFELGLTVTILLGVVAAVDVVLSRRRALGALKMTKDEVRREAKDTEGDPLLRGIRRRRARQLAFSRMMDAVPTADVVVTNPVHLAVALRYDPQTMRAPRIVAKGQRLVAERIREIARRAGVPIVEDRPLARALFPRPLGSEVPPHLYRAVARILVLVARARVLAGRGPGAEGRHR
ncbi:MAG TPA: EscU/YscU/HrcU family type III secretion system export apparatus switch protein [Candidatus Binatia bacterium]|nr:EscU/YscU/HrcU family type III secretion system export apparatus switch protein [Candidatus Binatia bacterium]